MTPKKAAKVRPITMKCARCGSGLWAGIVVGGKLYDLSCIEHAMMEADE